MNNALVYALLVLVVAGLWRCKSGQKSNTNNSTREKPVQASVADTLKKRGELISRSSGKALIKQLQKAIGKGGIDYATTFCSEKAMPLTDSLSAVHNAQISRVSHRNRNPANEADSLEKRLINKYQHKLSHDDRMQPRLVVRDEQPVYYHPIKIKSGLCLNCHGTKGKMLAKSTFNKIRTEYPNGEAIGFEIGDLRGLWKVRFQKAGG
jgi:hypothetical protein